jgi:Ca2+-transporting ATPase
VTARREIYGPNELAVDKGPGPFTILARQFTSFLTALLAVAAIVSGFLLDEWIDAAAIAAIVILNATIGFVQEYRAARALEALRELTGPVAHVVRNGAEMHAPGTDVVPGDVLILDTGDRVPADARLLSVRDLEVDESTLTGESLPVAKTGDSSPPGAALGDQIGMVFSGTTVARGRGRAVVVATGLRSEMGRVATMTVSEEPATPLQRELARVGRRLAVISIGAGAFIFGIGALRSLPVDTLLLTGVALAVAVIPEGLPTVVAVTLARGMERMARWNALVRRLSAVEALGAAAVICTDKTGTITENRMAVQRIALAGVEDTPPADGATSIAIEDLPLPGDAAADRRLSVAADIIRRCNDAFATEDGLAGDALDVALLRDADRLSPASDGPVTRVAEVPFDSDRKRMSVVVERAGDYHHYMKGAPEVVIDRCSSVLGPEGLLQADGANLRAAAESMAARGLRTIAVAERRIDRAPAPGALDENDMTLVAVIGLADGARAGVAESVAEAHRAGIDVVMITGDHKVTATAIGHQVGIVNHADQVMSGEHLRAAGPEELAGEIDRYRAFSRVDPADKVKIVHAWQAHDKVVAMTGDGVNDAPALRAADIGVAMGSGTDIAKDAAGLVLQDDNFSTIVNAVREGRKIFANLRNVVHYLLSSNASEVLTMVIGFGLFGFLGETLRPTQLLWINLVSDGLPALALGVDETRDDVMAQRPGEGRDVLSAHNISLLLTQGTFLAVAPIGAIIVGHYLLDAAWATTQTMVFMALVVTQLLHAFNMSRARTRILGPLALAVAISFMAQVAVVNVEVTRSAFGLVSLNWVEWAWSIGLAFVGFLGARVARNAFDQRG